VVTGETFALLKVRMFVVAFCSWWYHWATVHLWTLHWAYRRSEFAVGSYEVGEAYLL